jgi:hypothetical protein
MLLMMWRSSRREIVKARRIKKVEEVMETDVLIKNLREAANKWDRDNPNPPTFSTVYSVALRDAASRLEEYEKIIAETQKPNNVLSIEDLQRMNGQPVWIEDIHEWAIVSVDENGYYEGIPFAQGHCFNWNIKDRNLKCYRKPPVSNTQEDN